MAEAETQIDNETFRVIRWTIEPGGEIPMHTHEYDYAVVPLVNGRMHTVNPQGEETDVELRVGQSYTRSRGVEHVVLNRGSDPVVFVEVEIISER